MKKSVGCAVILSGLLALSMQSVSADAKAELFSELDVNADGFVSVEEAEAHDDLPEAFSDSDMNDDGRLDQAEFANLEITDE